MRPPSLTFATIESTINISAEAEASALYRHALPGQRGSLYGTDVRPLLMTMEESLDLDTPADLALIEWTLARRR